jgi:DNA transformation protein and related proteins
MHEIKGNRLHVKLGASQVRRRLKGLGFGVRKVESAGRGEAVIIHTATGQHLRELCAIFQDVIERAIEVDPPPVVEDDAASIS